MKSVYQEGFEVIDRLPGTGTAVGMAKLLLSLYNPSNGFSVADCIKTFDRDLVQLALRMIATYAAEGEGEELRRVGWDVVERFPGLAK